MFSSSRLNSNFLIHFFCHKGRVRLPNQMNKNSKGPLTPPLIFGKLCCKFFMTDMVAYMQGGMMTRQYQMHAHDFQRGANCRLEPFRKFIQFGSVTRPLHTNTHRHTHTHTQKHSETWTHTQRLTSTRIQTHRRGDAHATNNPIFAILRKFEKTNKLIIVNAII